jgi:hypothetical protein
MGGVGLTVYSDTNFRGRNATFRQDTPDLQPFGLNDRIASLQVAPGEMWEACEHINFGGRCQVFSGTEPDLGRRGWGNMISSVRRIRGGGGGRPPGRRGLELYSGEQFEGERRELTSGLSDFRRIDFNDRAMSLRLPPSSSWQICADINFVRCTVVNSDWPDLGRLNMRNQISSARPWNSGGGGRSGPFPPTRFRLVLYEDRGYRGRSYTTTGSVPLVPSSFNDKASSVQVSGGVWELCEDRDFGGRCVTISRNVSDLGSVGLRNEVSSVRPRGSPR